MSTVAGTIVVVGFGSAGQRHVRNLRALGCDDFVLVRSRRGALAGDAPAGVEVASIAEALAYRPRVAIIASPTALHLTAALELARAGCDLFIEKPLAADRDLEACEALLSLVRERRLVTAVGCQFRFHPLLGRLRDGLARLGATLAARAEWGEYLPDWHPWEDHRSSYAARADLGGGALLTLVHTLDTLYWFFGPGSVCGALMRRVPSLETSCGDDWVDVSLRFEAGVLGSAHMDFVQRPAVHRFTVWGDRGRAEWDYHAGRLDWIDRDGGVETERVPDGFERNQLFLDEMRHFLTCVTERRPTRVPLEEGLAVLRMVRDARRAAAT